MKQNTFKPFYIYLNKQDLINNKIYDILIDLNYKQIQLAHSFGWYITTNTTCLIKGK
jgi:uncharacterized protein YaaQ